MFHRQQKQRLPTHHARKSLQDATRKALATSAYSPWGPENLEKCGTHWSKDPKFDKTNLCEAANLFSTFIPVSPQSPEGTLKPDMQPSESSPKLFGQLDDPLSSNHCQNSSISNLVTYILAHTL